MRPTLARVRFARGLSFLISLTASLLTIIWLFDKPVLANGSLDPSFGNNGIARIAFDPSYTQQFPTGVAVRPDGKIIVVGSVSQLFNTPNIRHIALTRLNSDGTLDSTFGNGGRVIVRPLNLDSVILSIALQPDGRFVIAGYTKYFIGEVGFPRDIILLRYDADGSLDTTFGNGGIVTTDIRENDVQTDLKLQNDGKIVVSGYTYSISTPGSPTMAMIARYNQNGSLDATFGTNGIFQSSAFKQFVAIAIQSDSKIVAAGFVDPILEMGLYLLARYDTNGLLDSSFGNNGVVTTEVRNGLSSSYGSGINDIAIQPDGKIVAAGYPLIRYLSNGSIDPSFAVTYNSQSGYYLDFARGFGGQHVAIRSDGKIVVNWPRSLPSNNDIGGLVGKDGVLIGITLRQDAWLRDSGKIAIQPDDKLLLYGPSFNNPDPAGPAFIIVRYQTITSLSAKIASFIGDGKTDFGVYRPSTGNWYIALGPGIPFGTTGDFVCPADYDGDGRSELAIWRPPSGNGQAYFCHEFSYPPYSRSCTPWGLAGDVPVAGDFDGDTLTDMAVFRQGIWHVLRSMDGVHRTIIWGLAGDQPVPGDYDGDGVTDVANFRPSNGTWYVQLSSNGTTMSQQFGIGTDKLVPGDYDGDGRTDFAVFRNGTWYIQQSTAGFREQQFGLGADRPVPGDYDGDGRTDLGVFRNGTWYLLQSTRGLSMTQWGQDGDIPLSPGFVNQ